MNVRPQIVDPGSLVNEPEYCPFCSHPLSIDEVEAAPYHVERCASGAEPFAAIFCLCAGCQQVADRYGLEIAAWREGEEWTTEAGEDRYTIV